LSDEVLEEIVASVYSSFESNLLEEAFFQRELVIPHALAGGTFFKKDANSSWLDMY